MPGAGVVGLILMACMLALSALSSGSETALLSLSHADRLRLRKSHPSIFVAAQELVASPRSLLVAILLSNTLVNMLYFTLAGFAGKSLFGENSFGAMGFAAAAVLLLILFGEVIPKAIAAIHRVRVCRVIALPMLAWFRLVAPLRIVLDKGVVAPLARLFRPAGRGEPEGVSPADLSRLLQVGQEQGVLPSSEQQLLADVVGLGTLRVRNIMCPRVDVAWIDATATSQELLALARDTGFARFPVCRGAMSEGRVVGVVHSVKLLPALGAHGAAARLPLASLVQPAHYVPERARVDQLLDHFRATRTDAALVVSEVGDITGFVQIDDVITQLVKFAAAEQGGVVGNVREVDEGVWEVPGRLSVRDWETYFDPGAPERAHKGATTVGGLILSRLGRVPMAGDEVRVGNVLLRVEAMDERTVERVRVRVAPIGTPAGAPGGDA